MITNLLKKKALHDVSLVYLGAILNSMSLFLINVILSRSFEKEWFAIFSLSVLALGTIAEMSDLGLNGSLLRFIPFYKQSNEPEKLKQVVRTIWRWRVWLSIILTLGGIILSYPIAKYVFDQPQINNYLAFSFLGIGGVVLLGFVSTYLQANQQFFKNSLIQSLKGLSRLALTAIFIFSGLNDAYLFLLIYISTPWILLAFYYHVLPRDLSKIQIEAEVKEKLHSQIANFSFWLTIWSLSAILASRIDQVMLSNLLSLEKVAIYTIAFQFIYLYSMASQSITSVLMPKFNSLRSKEEIVALAKKLIKWLIPITILLFLIIPPSKYLITFVFGNKYADSMPVYLILSYGMALNLFNIPLSLIITTFNRTKLIAISGFIQLMINVGLNLLLIPKFGVIGAGLTFAIGIAFSLVYNSICSSYLIKKEEINIT